MTTNWVALSNRDLFSHSSGGQSSEITSVGLFSGDCEGDPFPCLSPGFWWLPAILGTPQLVDTSLQDLFPHDSLCVLSSSYKDTSR